MAEQKRILIGEITTAHGIKGFVKVRCYADDETLLEHDGLSTEDGKPISLKLKNAAKNDWTAEVEGVNDRNEAERLRGTKLYIDRDSLPETADGEYYIEDLKGMTVVDTSGKKIGTVLSVQNFGAGDLLDVKPPQGANHYLPFFGAIVDAKAGTITVEMPEIIE